MKTRLILTNILVCFILYCVQAQDKKRIGIYDLGVGISSHSILEESYAPFPFNSVNPYLRFSFERDKNGHRMEAGLDLTFGTTNYNDFELFQTNLINVDLYLLYAKAIKMKNEKMNFHLGAIVDYDILFLINMRDEFDAGNISYNVALSLGPYAALEYQFNEQNIFKLVFDMPILTQVVRNPYTGYDQNVIQLTEYGDNLPPVIFHKPKLTHGFDYFRPNLSFEWQKKFEGGRIISPKVSIQYLNYEPINPIAYFQTNFSIGLKF